MSDKIDAILIASATPTHTQFITMGAKSGKAVCREKGIKYDKKLLRFPDILKCSNQNKQFKEKD